MPELPEMGLLECLTEDERRLLSSYGEFFPAKEGQVIIEEGKAQDSLWFVISGTLHATTTRENAQTLLGRIGPGESLGELNIFDSRQASASVKAMEFSQVWKIDRPALQEFMNEYPLAAAQLLMEVAATLGKRLRAANDKLAERPAVS